MGNKTIRDYIEEFFLMKRGEEIKNPFQKLFISQDFIIKRIGLKHIVESRSRDGYPLEEIKNMLDRIFLFLEQPEFDIPNTNGKYPKSRIIGKSYPFEDRALLAIYQPEGRNKVIYNLYYRRLKKFIKMK